MKPPSLCCQVVINAFRTTLPELIPDYFVPALEQIIRGRLFLLG
jgi:hypothetical protein